jgi:glycosyltransferase involved in cell wall biosynthesis
MTSADGWPFAAVDRANDGSAPAPPLTITTVVPSYNQGGTLERTIRSVLLQGYPNLELIVMDGGSTDQSVEILNRYGSWLTYWQSKRDGGQSQAINEGFKRSKGEIVTWLCSDDYLMPGALHRVASEFQSHDADVVAGACRCLYAATGSEYLWKPNFHDLPLLPLVHVVAQSSCFFRRTLLRPEALRPDLHYTMDLELWTYFRKQGVRWRFIDDLLSVADNSGENKTQRGRAEFQREQLSIYHDYANGQSLADRLEWGERCMTARNFRFAMMEAKKCIAMAPWSVRAGSLLARAAWAGGHRKLRHLTRA